MPYEVIPQFGEEIIAKVDPMPLGFAIAIVGVIYSVGIYAFLTCFHPAWKRPLHWGRMKRGPILSRWSHVIVGTWSIVTPWVIVGPSFGIHGVAATSCSVVAAIVTGAMFAVFIYDCVVHGRRPST